MSFMSKTAAFIGLGALRDVVSDQIAIDMGSASTIIWLSGQGVVVDEPSMVLVNSNSGEIIGVGTDAEQMLGREARDVRVIAPMINGVVGDFERTREMLTRLVAKARREGSYFSRRAVISVLSGMTEVEQRALLNVAQHSKIGRVWMVEEGLAAALGAGINVTDSRASAIVDVGAGATNVAIVSGSAIIHSAAERIGSSAINVALINHIRRHRGLSIGPRTSERLKLQLASATPPEDLASETVIKGHDVQTGKPDAITITAGEIYPVVQFVVGKILELVSHTLPELSPEVAGDIYERGIILTGGGAQLRGLDEYLSDRVGVPVQTAYEPKYATVRGLAQMFDQPLTMRHLARVPNKLVWTGSGSSQG